MADVLVRSTVTPLESVGDGRTVIGMICPYDKAATVDDGFGPYRELFERGAFQRVMKARPHFVRVHLEHPGEWVGKGERWLDSDEGLTMALRLDDTEGGRTAAFKIRDGQTPGLSIGFVPGRTKTVMHADGPVEHRVSIRTIHHVALCPQPAYADAKVAAVRSKSYQETDRLDLWQQWLQAQQQQ